MISEHQGDSWKPTTLEHCGRWISGGTPSRDRSDFWNGTVPWISAKSMNCIRLSDSEEHVTHLGAENGAKFAPKGSILILVRGSMLHQRIPIGITTKDVTFNQDVKAIIPYSDVFPEFLLYWLLSNESKLLEMVEFTGIGAGKLSTDLLYNMQVKLPPLPEQRAIARFFGTLDDKIELNRRTNETLESIARVIFKSWFVDFDPVRAKAEGRGPAGMDAETAALFPDSFEDTELGMVPKGWRCALVGNEVQVIKGVSYRSEDLAESYTALVTLKSITRGGGYRSDGLKQYRGEYKSEQMVCPGELIVAQTDVTQAADVIGKPALVLPDDMFKILVASLDILIVRPINKDLPREFFYLLFLTPEFQDHIYGHTNGTTVLHLSKTGIQSYVFVRPSARIAHVFQEAVVPIFQRIAHNEQESRTLASLRDMLLSKLINGEIQLKDAEQFLKSQRL